MHAIAAKAICFKEAMSDDYKAYQHQVVKNAQAMAEVIMARGYDVVSGGTNNHLMLISLIKQGITGKEADKWLGDAHITVNKNAVPNDPKSPFVTSGIRIGTPAITTRGFGDDEVRQLADWICDILDARGDEQVLAEVRQKVEAICKEFPVYERNASFDQKAHELFKKVNEFIDTQANEHEVVAVAKQKATELYEKLNKLVTK